MLGKGILVLSLFPFLVKGGGFETSLKGNKAAGMGNTFTAVANDASSVYFNPGALSLFDKKVMLAGGALFATSKTSYLSPYDGNTTTDNPLKTNFNFYGSFKFGDRFSAGIAYYSPFGYHYKWSDTWEGKYISQESELSINSVQPTVSYAVSENFGVGAGFIYSFGNMNLRNAVPAGNTYGIRILEGKGKANGFNIGAIIRFNEELTGGLTFRSSQTFKVDDGTYGYSGIPASLAGSFPTSGTYTTELKMPSVISGALQYKFTDELITTVEFNYSNWSKLETVDYVASDSLASFSRDLNLSNSLSGRVGVQYSFTEEFDVRGGFAYEVSPFNSDHVNAIIPDANKLSFALGCSYKVSDSFGFDLVAGIENYFERQGRDLENNMTGSYKSLKYFFGAGLSYNF